ncbi:protein TRANSPARENT TESTA [Musa troglodytarum]|uniref:Protein DETOXIFICATION n=1 Tax=Musa troglodytarum TaxID=320322 RepID=A0A9E7L9B2_9LILI|nr:protein TRANSPARENT TESTA [Musa troglodytarum]
MITEEKEVPLLTNREVGEALEPGLPRRVWNESKRLWRIVGPAIFLRTTSYSMNLVTQAFAGHLGDLELAAMSLGMASALETLCGQAYGAKKHHMLGVYLQRSWIVLLGCAVLLLPIYIQATPLLELVGEPAELAREAGRVCIWFIPMHLSFAFLFPLNRFFQSQLKNSVSAVASGLVLAVHIFLSWLVVYKLDQGLRGASLTLCFSWWLQVLGQFAYVVCGGCPQTWKGFSMDAFLELWEFVKLSAASGVMLCLENWYYLVLILLTGSLKNAEIAVDAISICMNINNWELMIPLAFFAGTGVRVANELGAGNSRGAKFATVVSVVTSTVIGLFNFCVIVVLHDKFALIFSSSTVVLDAVDKLSLLLAIAILLNSIQPILSGVAVGAGWQATVAYVNVGSYYLIGIPVGVIMGWVFHLGVRGVWAGMIGGTAVQTVVLIYLTMRCDWDKELGMASALETLCGQAYGAKKHHMLGVYLQRSWIVLLGCAVLLLPLYIQATPLLELMGEPAELAREAGRVCIWFIPMHLSFAFLFPLNRFFQSQLKNSVSAVASGLVLAVHIFLSWLVVYKLDQGLRGASLTLCFSWWLQVLGQFAYVVCGGCPQTWKGFSMDAFLELWEFVKLSAASGVMLCLENWYYRVLILLTGSLKNAEIAVDAISICMNINNWELMIPLAFFAGTGCSRGRRVASNGGFRKRWIVLPHRYPCRGYHGMGIPPWHSRRLGWNDRWNCSTNGGAEGKCTNGEMGHFKENSESGLLSRVWNESKKLWRIVGPAIFLRTTSYSMILITQAFAGHLGDDELAAVSFAFTFSNFSFGLMACLYSSLIMIILILVNMENPSQRIV